MMEVVTEQQKDLHLYIHPSSKPDETLDPLCKILKFEGPQAKNYSAVLNDYNDFF